MYSFNQPGNSRSIVTCNRTAPAAEILEILTTVPAFQGWAADISSWASVIVGEGN